MQVPRSAVGSSLVSDPSTGLALSRWDAQEPRAVVLAVHGFGDYGESTFADAAAWWAEDGITTIAYDQRGFGRNVSRGYWPGADVLVTDLKAIAARVRAAHPCLPLFVVGHSMGGGVVLAAATDLDAEGIVLAAPAIWGESELNPFHRLLAWTAASVVPDKRFTGEGVVRIQASDNIEALRALGRDPFYLSPPSAREIFGLVRVTDRAARASVEVKLPALLLLGEKDQIVPNAAVERMFARLKGSTQVVRYEEGWHLLFRDLQAQRVWQDVADWTRSESDRSSCSSTGSG
ncbi:MAG: alpha/beta fold hydrolase [Pseudomonadota bacterium]